MKLTLKQLKALQNLNLYHKNGELVFWGRPEDLEKLQSLKHQIDRTYIEEE